MILPPLLRLSYWFGLNPAPFLPMVDRLLLVLFSAMVIAGILAHVAVLHAGLEKMTKRIFTRSGTMLVSMGLFGLVLYFINYERLPVLSMRFGFLIWLAIAIVLGRRIYRFARIEIPAMRERNEARQAFGKWLPKGK